ncbi:putative protein phosphatase 4 core regulatory subunit R2 [Helianthus annuus]|nr:putative protein phosphatase 4 core regulatory subunit R2 [Helianthus annuus]
MASDVEDNRHVNLIVSPENHQGREMRQETAEEEEEVKHVLKIIAATGKFWYDWEKLRSMLSLHLMQVCRGHFRVSSGKNDNGGTKNISRRDIR